MSTSRATCAATKQHGLAVTSGLPQRPTCYMSVIFARIDHLLAKGCSANSTKIPTCLVTHRISRIPCYHVLVVALDYLGITKPTVSYLVGVWSLSWLIAIALSWAWLPVVFVFLILSSCSHRNRCKWALREWGSDHLPVVCSLTVDHGAGSTETGHVSGV